jgi:hypothetical protein
VAPGLGSPARWFGVQFTASLHVWCHASFHAVSTKPFGYKTAFKYSAVLAQRSQIINCRLDWNKIKADQFVVAGVTVNSFSCRRVNSGQTTSFYGLGEDIDLLANKDCFPIVKDDAD